MKPRKQTWRPQPSRPRGFKIVSVPLFNDPEDPNAFGDTVGVATTWKLPGVFAGVQTGDVAKVQAKIDSGDWAQSVQAGDWAGYAIAEVLDIDVSEGVQKERVKKMLAAWIESGVLKVLQRPSPKTRGRNRPAVVVGNRVAGPEVDET